jgi:hypothetical protein
LVSQKKIGMRKNILIVVLVFSNLVALGWAFTLQAQRATAELGNRHEPLAGKTADARPVPVASTVPASPAHSVAAAPPALAPAAEDGALAENTSGKLMDDTVMRLNDPQVMKELTAQYRAQVERRYGELFKNLNLSPTELEHFKQLLVDTMTLKYDVFAAAKEKGAMGTKEFGDMLSQEKNRLAGQIKTALGEDGYRKYSEFLQSQAQRNVVNLVQQSLAFSATPLTPQQQVQLLQTVATTGPQPRATSATGGATAPVPNASGLITRETITQARAFLSDTQVRALALLGQEQQAALRLRLALQQSAVASAKKP